MCVDNRSTRIAAGQRGSHNPLDELALPSGVGFLETRIARIRVRSERSFQRLVFPGGVGVLTQEIPKRERPFLLGPAGLHHVDVMAVRPPPRTMKERTERIVFMQHVDVPEES